MYHATIFGIIGVDALAADLVKVLEAFTKDGDEQHVTVRLNSGGGRASEALAMNRALKDWPGSVDVYIEGVAAGPAVLVACAGENITMAPGSMLGIAEPVASTFCTAPGFAAMAEAFTAAADEMRARIGERFPHAGDIADVMQKELWLTAAEAVAKRYANILVRDTGVPPASPAPFPYAKCYLRPPAALFFSNQDFTVPEWTERV